MTILKLHKYLQKIIGIFDMVLSHYVLYGSSQITVHSFSEVRSEGLKPSCYTNSGLDQLERKPSIPSRSVVQNNSSNSCKPNWHDNASIVFGSACG